MSEDVIRYTEKRIKDFLMALKGIRVFDKVDSRSGEVVGTYVDEKGIFTYTKRYIPVKFETSSGRVDSIERISGDLYLAPVFDYYIDLWVRVPEEKSGSAKRTTRESKFVLRREDSAPYDVVDKFMEEYFSDMAFAEDVMLSKYSTTCFYEGRDVTSKEVIYKCTVWQREVGKGMATEDFRLFIEDMEKIISGYRPEEVVM